MTVALFAAGTLVLPVCGDGGAREAADAGTDPDSGSDCGDSDYPVGPYVWYLDEVVSDVAFPAMFDGVETELDMSAAHCAGAKSLVFALGADTCPSCPARFGELGGLEDGIHDANGELVGLYWADTLQPGHDRSRDLPEPDRRLQPGPTSV